MNIRYFIYKQDFIKLNRKGRAEFTPPFLTLNGRKRVGFIPLEYGIKKVLGKEYKRLSFYGGNNETI